MSKLEIKERFGLNIVQHIWWKFIPGTTTTVKWPVGEVVIDESMPQWDWTIGPSKYIVESSDPNDHYRPYLEKHVGKQGWDWDWLIEAKDNTQYPDQLRIRFRKGKEEWASITTIMWT